MIRYVGKTYFPLVKRLSGHLRVSRYGAQNHRCNWIRSLLSKGYLPSIQLVGEVEGDGSKEERAWIKYFKDEGVNLVNKTDGGDGFTGIHKKGWKHTEEAKRKMRGRVVSDETKKIMSIWQKGKKKNLSEESKLRFSEAQKGKILSPEHRKKMSVSQRKRWKNYARNKMPVTKCP